MNDISEWPKIRPSGDSAVLVEFDNRIDPEVNRAVRSLALTIEAERFPGINEVLPAYRTLMVTYDPLEIEYEALLEKIKIYLGRARNMDLPARRTFRLPTVYGGAHGPDLQRVSEILCLPPEEVIEVFSKTHFLVYFIGFICGLAYLGGLPDQASGAPPAHPANPCSRRVSGVCRRPSKCHRHRSTFGLQLYWKDICDSL